MSLLRRYMVIKKKIKENFNFNPTTPRHFSCSNGFSIKKNERTI